MLLTALAALGLMFGATEVAVGFYRAKQTQLAKMWFQEGTSALAAHRPQEAIQDLQNALSYAPDNSTYQLSLAQALAAANRIDEAESYLLDLWSSEPGNGEINLELARLEARRSKPDAARYYNNAIYGVWYGVRGTDPLERRWDARMELLHYWLTRHNLPQAQAVLLALAANVPPGDYRRHTLVGQLQLEAEDPHHALEQFQLALRLDRRYASAQAGAGEAEFAIGEYHNAIPYLESAIRLDPQNHRAASQLRITRLVLASDPFELGLDERQQTERAIDDYLQAISALASCATEQGVIVDAAAVQNPLQESWALGQQQQALMTRFRGQSQAVLQLMNFVFSAEDLAAKQCGPLQGKDQALWLIGRMHRLAENNGQGGA